MRHGVGGEDPEGEGGGEGASLTLSAAFLWCVAARQRSLGNPTKTDDQTTSHSWSWGHMLMEQAEEICMTSTVACQLWSTTAHPVNRVQR